jgi:hypothetical protein
VVDVLGNMEQSPALPDHAAQAIILFSIGVFHGQSTLNGGLWRLAFEQGGVESNIQDKRYSAFIKATEEKDMGSGFMRPSAAERGPRW